MDASPPIKATEDVSLAGGVEVWRIPLGYYVDAVRWMPPATAWNQSLAIALWDPDTGKCMLQLSSLVPDEGPSITSQASWDLPARVSALRVSPLSSQQALIASSNFLGSLCFIVTKLLGPSVASPAISSVPIHDGTISDMDLQSETHDCVSVGEDGKINLTKFIESQPIHSLLTDNHGLTSFTAVHWASPAEFVTAGLGFSLQWWDQRRSGGPVQMSNKWSPSKSTGTIHTIDVHPSRKHVCVVGGSNGTILAWDLRWQKEPIQLCGSLDLRGHPRGDTMAESDVWEIKFDSLSLSGAGVLSSKIPPIMMCSEDGILGVLESGEAPLEILAEPCAINSLDINEANPTDVVCGLEFESLLHIKRSS